jgi:hypothetical protein
MEELNDTPPPNYTKGFNDGYLIAKHLPEPSKDLVKSLSDTEQSKGFQAGIRQVFLEKAKNYEPAWMKSDFIPNEPDRAKDDREQDVDKE